MNWKKEAENELRNYPRRKDSLENMKERICALQEKYKATKTSSCDAVPISGGGNRMEDNLINNIVERERLILTYKATSRLVKLTERGLDSLSERERTVIDRFYFSRASGHIESLMSELHIEQSQVYRIKDDAIYHFTLGEYGIVDY